MSYKKLIYIIIISIIVYNIDILIGNINKYNVNNFTKKQLSEKKWRCIVYYNDNDTSGKYKYFDRSCLKYKHDYINFLLEKNNAIFNYILKKYIAYIAIYIIYISII